MNSSTLITVAIWAWVSFEKTTPKVGLYSVLLMLVNHRQCIIQLSGGNASKIAAAIDFVSNSVWRTVRCIFIFHTSRILSILPSLITSQLICLAHYTIVFWVFLPISFRFSLQCKTKFSVIITCFVSFVRLRLLSTA